MPLELCKFSKEKTAQVIFIPTQKTLNEAEIESTTRIKYVHSLQKSHSKNMATGVRILKTLFRTHKNWLRHEHQ